MTPPVVQKELYAGFNSEAVDLKLSTAKIKVLHVGYESDPEPIFTLDGTAIDSCDMYNYLVYRHSPQK